MRSRDHQHGTHRADGGGELATSFRYMTGAEVCPREESTRQPGEQRELLPADKE
jgi:hypothetical protein